MAELAYIFGDAITGYVIEEIRLTSVSMKQMLGGGEFRATFALDQTGKTNDQLLSATIPGKCFVAVERDGQVIGDFLIWTRTYQSQAKVFNLYATSFKDYTECRFITSSYSATDVEQRNIFIDLYNMMQSVDGSIRIDLPDVFSTQVTKTLTVSGAEYKTYRQVMDAIADAADGFDWVIRTARSGNKYVRWLDIGYPQIGALPGRGIPIFEYISPSSENIVGGGNIINYWANDGMSSAGTHFYGIGSGEGDSMLVANINFNDLIANGFPRYDVSLDRKDVNNISVLTSLTFLYAQIHKSPMSTITAEVKADGDPPFGGYGLGDACRIIIKDARFPDGFQRDTRILGWEYYPPEDSNIEIVRLQLEGDDTV